MRAALTTKVLLTSSEIAGLSGLGDLVQRCLFKHQGSVMLFLETLLASIWLATEPEPCSNGGNIGRRTSEVLDDVLDGCCETLINSDPTTLVLVSA
jgi:hypothetical protein